MKIAISGSTGFIGGALREAFVNSGIDVVPLLRADFKRGENYQPGRSAHCETLDTRL